MTAKARTSQDKADRAGTVSDDTLSDHEWRLKMAAEGKEIYWPGKSVEEIRAEADAKAQTEERPLNLVVTLSSKDWSVAETAIPDTIEILHDVGRLLRSMSYEEDLDLAWVNSALRLAARAVESMEEKEVAVLDRLGSAIRLGQRGLGA